MQRVFAAAILWSVFVLGPVDGRAADDGLPVYTDPQHVDDDFAFQGEYRGWQRSLPQSDRSSEKIGLQVIARGDGKFEAMKYPGGLPGGGWARGGNRYVLHGERTNDTVKLNGDKFDILLRSGTGAILTKAGKVAGALQQVHRTSPTMGLAPPPGAVRLFTGSDTSLLKDARLSPEGWLLAGTETVNPYRNFRMHAEFYLPYKPAATGQARANSGFYLQCRYEVQILDSFGLPGLFNECGALYRSIPPDVNMCLPPLEWQTYEIDFREPLFDAQGHKTDNARISVWHNGVVVQNDVEIPNKTGAGKPEGPELLPIKIQDHGNPVMFRNIWLVETTGAEPSDWPPLPSAPPPARFLLGRSE